MPNASEDVVETALIEIDIDRRNVADPRHPVVVEADRQNVARQGIDLALQSVTQSEYDRARDLAASVG